jgi:hypothetical protein
MDRRERYLKHGVHRVGGLSISLDKFGARYISSLDAIQEAVGEAGALAEIGVYEGKLCILLALCARAGESCLAIDVFEDQHLNIDHSGYGNKVKFLHNMQKWAPAADLKIVQKSSLEMLPEEIIEICGRVRLASIDGSHTEECALNDLRLIEAVLTQRGVIMLDDCFNQAWPGVSSAIAKYLLSREGRLRPFAISSNKLYLALPEYTGFYRNEIMNRNAYYYEKSAHFLGYEVDIYGAFPYTLSLKRRVDELKCRVIEEVKRSPLGPYARGLRRFALRLLRSQRT